MLKLYSFIVVAIFTLLSAAQDGKDPQGAKRCIIPNEFFTKFNYTVYLEAHNPAHQGIHGQRINLVNMGNGKYWPFLEPTGVRSNMWFHDSLLHLNGVNGTAASLDQGRVEFKKDSKNFQPRLLGRYACDGNGGSQLILWHSLWSMFYCSDHMLFYHFLIFSVSIIGFYVCEEEIEGVWGLYFGGKKYPKHILSQIPTTCTSSKFQMIFSLSNTFIFIQ
jgi:hypothetical protein